MERFVISVRSFSFSREAAVPIRCWPSGPGGASQGEGCPVDLGQSSQGVGGVLWEGGARQLYGKEEQCGESHWLDPRRTPRPHSYPVQLPWGQQGREPSLTWLIPPVCSVKYPAASHKSTCGKANK